MIAWTDVVDQLPKEALHDECGNFVYDKDRKIIFKDSNEKHYIGFYVKRGTIKIDDRIDDDDTNMDNYWRQGFWAIHCNEDCYHYIKNVVGWEYIERYDIGSPPPMEKVWNCMNYQQQAAKTEGKLEDRDALLLGAIGIAGEAGEVAELIKKHIFHGRELDYKDLCLEIGDVLWYIALLCRHSHGFFDFWDCIIGNMKKVSSRYPDGFKREDKNIDQKIRKG